MFFSIIFNTNTIVFHKNEYNPIVHENEFYPSVTSVKVVKYLVSIKKVIKC